MFYKIAHRLYFIILLMLIIYSPIPFGSVLPDSILWIEGISVFLLILSLLIYNQQQDAERFSLKIKFIIPVVALFFIAIIQLIPLSANLITIISPQTMVIKQLAHNSYLKNIIVWLGQTSNLSLPAASFFPDNCLSLYPYASLYKLLFLAAMGMFWISLILAIRTKSEIRLLLTGVIISGTLQSVLYLMGYVRGKPLLSRLYGYEIEQIGGTFVNRNHYSAYLSMVLPVFTVWLFYYSHQVMKSHRTSTSKAVSFIQHRKGLLSFLMTMLIIMAVGQLLSLSRAGIGSCILSFGVLIYLLNRGIRRIKITTIVILLLIIIAALTYWIGYYPIIHKFRLIPQEWQSSLGRWTIWKDSIKIIKDFPVFGIGLSNYGSIFPHYKSFIDTKYLYAHNDFLQVATEMGLTGLSLLIIAIIFFYRQVLTHPWQKHSRTRALATGIIAATCAMLIHSFFDFPLQVPANAILLTLYCGLLFALMRIDSHKRQENLYSKKEPGFEK